jgi:hypothetical protein
VSDPTPVPDLPDPELRRAYEKAATQNVLAARDDSVFPGYYSVCADRVGFGPGNSYPSLDGHQLADALLWLGDDRTVRLNWDYVRKFQRPNGQLPLAILPGAKEVAGAPVDPNGGLYVHWVKGDPLRALAGPTYIQNADVLYRHTLDTDWLRQQLPSVNLAADYLASLTTDEGLVAGAGYYIEFPTRVEYDGVAQCHAVDAFRRVAALNRVVGDDGSAERYGNLAEQVADCFRRRYWVGDHFGEYVHPERGLVDAHGLSDTNWAALAADVADPQQRTIVWESVRDEAGFYYGGVPTGIATRPDAYEDWEFTHEGHRHDLAAMGRVWYVECWARARLGDGDGIADTLRRVARVGEANGYYWRERYHPPNGTPAGPNTYCEYPANLIRITQRFLLGVELGLDGPVSLSPNAPASYWEAGFGQTLRWRKRSLAYQMNRSGVEGAYSGAGVQRVRVRLERGGDSKPYVLTVDKRAPVPPNVEGNYLAFDLPATTPGESVAFACRALRP